MNLRPLLRTATTTAAGIVLALAGSAQAAMANPSAALTGVDVSVTMHADQHDTVTATYHLTARDAASDARVTHTFTPRNDAQVGPVTPGDGVSAVRQNGTSKVSLTLADGTDTYTVRYTVRRSTDSYSVPLLTPDLPTARDATVRIRTHLPPGQVLAGDAMPSFVSSDKGSGPVTLAHRGGDLPSVVIAEYGTGRRLTLTDIVAVAGMAMLVGVVLEWWRRSRRPGPQEVSA